MCDTTPLPFAPFITFLHPSMLRSLLLGSFRITGALYTAGTLTLAALVPLTWGEDIVDSGAGSKASAEEAGVRDAATRATAPTTTE
jgi:hypothetical protein